MTRLRMLECLRVTRVLQSHLDDELDDSTAYRVATHLEACRCCGLRADTYAAIKRALARQNQAPEAKVARLREFADSLVVRESRPPDRSSRTGHGHELRVSRRPMKHSDHEDQHQPADDAYAELWQSSPKRAWPPPRCCGRMGTVCRPGQVTVPARGSMRTRSLESWLVHTGGTLARRSLPRLACSCRVCPSA